MDISLGLALSLEGGGALSPPTIAPVLDVTTELGINVAYLIWSASDKTTSPGFYYDVEVKIGTGSYSSLTTTTSRTYNDTQGAAAGETYTYRITPHNDYGGGPSSNTVGVVLPGESDGPILLGPDNTTNQQYVYDDFTLTWSAVAGAATYDLYKSTTDSSYTLWQADIAALFLDISLSAAFGVGNWWYVIANNGSGFYSGQSNHLNCIPVIPTPPATSRITEDAVTRLLEDGTTRTLEG
jgi:hypothetical protein